MMLFSRHAQLQIIDSRSAILKFASKIEAIKNSNQSGLIMKKERITLPDGRYLIYYQFEDEQQEPSQSKQNRPPEKTASEKRKTDNHE